MANHQWIYFYPFIVTKHLPIVGSDHGPILININSRNFINPTTFKFEAKWLLEENFINLVKSVWTTFIKGSFAFQLIRKTSLLK